MLKSPFSLKSPLDDPRRLYDGFNAPITTLDCGQKCAPHNPSGKVSEAERSGKIPEAERSGKIPEAKRSGKPFCCDICHAVPAAYRNEWNYLKNNTKLWHEWRGDKCASGAKDERKKLLAETPDDMILLACLGPAHCQRPFRALSCRQFPFFPYVTSDYRFLGLAYDWEFENTCWVISNLGAVTETYRQQFIETHDRLFAFSQEVFDNYYTHSERMREHFSNLRRRIPLLHRNGGFYLLSPASERLEKVSFERLPQFGPYKTLP